jgi:lycopene beta-cyclase
MTTDLLVCGLGPSGRALAHRASMRGLGVVAVDPYPHRRWTATYAAWADELPDWIDASAVGAAVDRPVAWGTRRFDIDRRYLVFDTAALQDSLDLDRVQVIGDRVAEIGYRGRWARLSSGTVLTARRVIDARGVARSARWAEQTAFGVVLHRDRWHEPALFMDWRPDNGAGSGAPRSFLYAIPLNEREILAEETCLAGRPALGGAELRHRLCTRLRSRGIDLDGTEPVERVRFPLQGGRPGGGRIGTAGALTHPATGYSIATALATADAVVTGVPMWPLSARAVHRLRGAGLHALLALPPADLPLFFDTFFALPPPLQRAYLSGRTDPRATAGAMTTLWRTLPARLRLRLAMATLGPMVKLGHRGPARG